MKDETRTQILRLLGESATLRNQIAQADTYLAGIDRERARLVREGEAHTLELRNLNGLERTREIQERINRNQNRRTVAELELSRLDREESKTKELRPKYVARMEECDKMRGELEAQG